MGSVWSKVAWAGRTASTVFGVLLIGIAGFGAVSIALGANGSALILGVLTNTSTAVTRLTGNVNGPVLRLDNNNPGTEDTALALVVQPGEPPLRVNSGVKVPLFNADKVDGRDAPVWAVVNSSGTISRAIGAADASRKSNGEYLVLFQKDVSTCAYSANLGGSNTFFTDNGIIQLTNDSPNKNGVRVGIKNFSGSTIPADFFLIVHC